MDRYWFVARSQETGNNCRRMTYILCRKMQSDYINLHEIMYFLLFWHNKMLWFELLIGTIK